VVLTNCLHNTLSAKLFDALNREEINQDDIELLLIVINADLNDDMQIKLDTRQFVNCCTA
jgi:hypothetical protein